MQHHQTIPQADHRTSPDIVGPSAIRAKNPLNTTRTCNKLRWVDWFTGEVR